MHFFDCAAEHFGTVACGQLPLIGLVADSPGFDVRLPQRLSRRGQLGRHDRLHARAQSPQQAVIWAAFFNFVAFLLFHLKVAATMGKGIIDPDIVDDQRHRSPDADRGLAWDIITWYWGLPTSSSHALIGGLVGAAVRRHGRLRRRCIWDGIGKTVRVHRAGAADRLDRSAFAHR